jgi:hypothetical protein
MGHNNFSSTLDCCTMNDSAAKECGLPAQWLVSFHHHHHHHYHHGENDCQWASFWLLSSVGGTDGINMRFALCQQKRHLRHLLSTMMMWFQFDFRWARKHLYVENEVKLCINTNNSDNFD